MAFNTAYDLESLVVNTKAATVFTAHEQSLFLGGDIIPMVNLPAGSITAQIPVMGSVTAEKISSSSDDTSGSDFSAQQVGDTKVTIESNIYAARSVLRDLGGIDPSDLGRVLGNSIQAKFDADVVSAMNGFTASTSDGDPVTIDSLFEAAAQIRGTGETGPLIGIVSSFEAGNLMKDVGSTSYAGGDFQTEALRNGFLGTIAGIRMFQSSYMNAQTNRGYIFAQDAMRIAMFKNVDLEIGRRPEAVGFDIVANLHAGVGVVDATRGVKLVNV